MPTDKLEIVIDDMDEFVGREIGKLALEIQATLIEFTPIDLGWARANYVPKINAPYRENLSIVEPSAGASAGRASQNQGELFRLAVSYRADHGPFYISNNVPYIGRLNDGHSPQAPAGFVQLAINTAISKRSSGI